MKSKNYDRVYGNIRYAAEKKASDATAGVSVYHSPGNKPTLTVTVSHGAGPAERQNAIAKAHAVAASHGYPTSDADITTSGYGDSHSTYAKYSM